MSSESPAIRNKNVGLCVRRVPAVMTPSRCAGDGPPIASPAMDGETRPTPIASASAALYHTVLPLNPAKALPLLAAELVNAYSTSQSPRGPGARLGAPSPCRD